MTTTAPYATFDRNLFVSTTKALAFENLQYEVYKTNHDSYGKSVSMAMNARTKRLEIHIVERQPVGHQVLVKVIYSPLFDELLVQVFGAKTVEAEAKFANPFHRNTQVAVTAFINAAAER